MGQLRVDTVRQHFNGDELPAKNNFTKLSAYFFGGVQTILLAYIILFDSFKWAQTFNAKKVEFSLWLMGLPIHLALFLGLTKNRPALLTPALAFYIHSIIDDTTFTLSHSNARTITSVLYVLVEALTLISVWRAKKQMEEERRGEDREKTKSTGIKLVAFFLGLLGLIALTHFCYTYNFEGKHAHILKSVFFYNFAGIPAHLALLFGLLRNNTSFFYPFIFFYTNNFIANIKVGLSWLTVGTIQTENLVYSIGAVVILYVVLKAMDHIEAQREGKKAN